jgi:hypothetical protein
MQSSATPVPAEVMASVKSDSADVLNGAPKATPADMAKRPAPKKRTPKKSPAAKATAPKTKEVHASSKNTPALVLTLTEAFLAALKSKKIDNAEMIRLCAASVKRSKRQGTDSTAAQNSRHAGLELQRALIAAK